MGDWRTVNIVGSIGPAEVEPLRAHLAQHFGPLSPTGHLFGLGDWPAAEIDAAGNLAERDYSPHDVYDALWPLRIIAPSMRLTVHVGGDWESTECVATITMDGDGVFDGPPEVATVRPVDVATAMGRMLAALTRGPL